jgi:predicted RNA binding protein with dsRBD fold (UPF0201 family)
MSINVKAESMLNPTEDEAKVERALQKLFPAAPIERISKPNDLVVLRIHGSGLECLSNLRSLIKRERIRGAARSILFSGARGQRIHMYLNKQAAFVGRISFCEPAGESPLGPISIEIESPDPQSIIDFLASSPGQGFSQEFKERRRR